ncbi:maleylpyruvate isomerase family mycothiol-dependent enzyme [Actinophytocola sp.]|uniref:maleylpyruvate isomerase family mycothiol-dependent enzyme n=1 Tax=Actinophytocola sp. TaxID=1872138 RepID=UPI002ED31ADC
MELRAQTGTFAEVVAGLEPDEKVPTCPEWLLRDLVGHIGQAPRWVAGNLRSGAPAPVPDPRDAEPGPRAGWTDWLLAGADELLDAVAEVGADTTVWTIVGPRPARWWVRRLLADLVVHTADAAFTADVPYPVSAERAADTISEGLELLATPGLASFPGDREGTIALRPSTGDGWLITRTTAGHAWSQGAAAADVTLRGSTQDLLLVLMRRIPLDQVTVTGDRALAAELLTYSV